MSTPPPARKRSNREARALFLPPLNNKSGRGSFLKANFVQPKKSKVKGEVLVAFVVEIDGSLTEIGVLSDAGFGTADEAIRVMSISPSWISGTLNGTKVRVQYLIKIPVNQQL